MKKITPKNEKKIRQIVLISIAAAIGVIAIGIGVLKTFDKLKQTYERQCIVTDAGEQIEIITGKIVPPRLFINHFGLTNGMNVAHIPFAELRERLIKDTPNLRDIKIIRTNPNIVRIEAFERIPVVRVIGSGPKANANYTADSEGVVFWYPRRDTTLLPIIRETSKTTSSPGAKLTGNTLSALWLLEEAADPTFSVLKIQEVDTTKQDYLFLTLADSSRVKFAWEEMDKKNKTSLTSLRRQLKRLSQAIQSNVAAGTKLWNATDWGVPGRIYANDPTKADN